MTRGFAPRLPAGSMMRLWRELEHQHRGGLGREIEQVREIIRIPVSRQSGSLPKSRHRRRRAHVILYGPPGTGKTLISKGLAPRSRGRGLHDSGSGNHQRLVRRERTEPMRNVFDRDHRQNAPAIILIDEETRFDRPESPAIAPRGKWSTASLPRSSP